MQRRGQGISINVVVIAAIALLVLVILSVLVIRAGGGTSKAGKCETIGGVCRASWEGDNGPCMTGEDRNTIATCADRGGEPTFCCMTI